MQTFSTQYKTQQAILYCRNLNEFKSVTPQLYSFIEALKTSHLPSPHSKITYNSSHTGTYKRNNSDKFYLNKYKNDTKFQPMKLNSNLTAWKKLKESKTKLIGFKCKKCKSKLNLIQSIVTFKSFCSIFMLTQHQFLNHYHI